MRALTIVSDLGLGGTQRVAQNYATGYQLKGHAAAVLALQAGGPRGRPLAELGIPVFVGGESSAQRDDALERAIEWQPNVIHVHRAGRFDPRTSTTLERIRQAVADRHVILETNVFGKVDYTRSRFLIDVHMPVSRWSFWKWSKWISRLEPRPVGVVMPNLVDTSAFRPVSNLARERYRDKVGIPRDAVVFGRVGQPSKPKWSPIILSAFADVAKRRSDAYLLLAGVPAELQSRIRALPASVRRRVVDVPFMDSDDDLRLCYGAMDIFLHASKIGESFGLVLAEAMLCERPVVTLSTPSKDNSQLEVVRHGLGGLVVNDQKSMVQAMEWLREDPSLRERLGRDAAASVRRRYDLAQNIDALVKIGQIALGTDTRDRLRDELAADPELVTHVPTSEIEAMLRQSLGRVSVKERLLMDIVHTAPVYRFYSRFASVLGKT